MTAAVFVARLSSSVAPFLVPERQNRSGWRHAGQEPIRVHPGPSHAGARQSCHQDRVGPCAGRWPLPAVDDSTPRFFSRRLSKDARTVRAHSYAQRLGSEPCTTLVATVCSNPVTWTDFYKTARWQRRRPTKPGTLKSANRREPISLFSWIVLGLIAGWVASKIVGGSDQVFSRPWASSTPRFLVARTLRGFNFGSILVAIIESIIALATYHAITSVAS
jgi:uncharacterized membrane protein YeaQ/YmgE (transglycosylase-associated protein family)